MRSERDGLRHWDAMSDVSSGSAWRRDGLVRSGRYAAVAVVVQKWVSATLVEEEM